MNTLIMYVLGYKNNYACASRFGLQKQNLLGYKNIFFGLQKQKESAGYKNKERESYKKGYKMGYKD